MLHDDFRYAFRASGWIPAGERGYPTRLTVREQSKLSDEALLAIGAEIARTRNLSEGHVVVGIWSNTGRYIEPPAFAPSRPGPLDDAIEDKAEHALQSALRRHPDDDAPPLADAAQWAAQGILYDLSDRGGFEILDGGLEEDVRAEIVSVIAAIVRRATTPRTPGAAA